MGVQERSRLHLRRHVRFPGRRRRGDRVVQLHRQAVALDLSVLATVDGVGSPTAVDRVAATLTEDGIFKAVKKLIKIKDTQGAVDDIDNLGNRRVRAVGELLENQYRIGLVRMERAIKERMSLQEIETLMRENKNILFVVGAGHLVGPQSVVDLLKQRGYKVKQQ